MCYSMTIYEADAWVDVVDDITVYFFVESSFGFADPWLLAFCIGLGERMLVYDLSLG